jgi:hypothetical protein
MAYIDDKLGTGEKVVHVAHQHPFVLVRAAGRFILIFLISLAVLAGGLILLQPGPPPNNQFQDTVRTILVIATLIAMFIGIIGFLVEYLFYMNEEYYITNERVIQVEGVFNKRELDSSLSKVNDIQTFQTVFGRMFGYGTVNIVTGNESGLNRLDYLNDPNEFKKKLLNAKNGLYGDASDLAPQPVQGGYIRTDDGERRYRVPPQQPQQPYQGGYDPRDPRAGGYPPQPQPHYNPAPFDRSQIPSMLQELARLRDAGVITQEEFQAKKNDLLSRM